MILKVVHFLISRKFQKALCIDILYLELLNFLIIKINYFLTVPQVPQVQKE